MRWDDVPNGRWRRHGPGGRCLHGGTVRHMLLDRKAQSRAAKLSPTLPMQETPQLAHHTLVPLALPVLM